MRNGKKLSILLNLLTPKLPAPIEDDLAKGILEAIDMDSYRVEKKAVMKIALADQDAAIEPMQASTSGRRNEPELDRLSIIFKKFQRKFRNSIYRSRSYSCHHSRLCCAAGCG